MQFLSKTLVSFVLFLLKTINLMPIQLINCLGYVVGTVGFYLCSNRRKVGIINLGLCFPNMNMNDKQLLIKSNFRELAIIVFAYSLVFFANKDKLRRIIKINGLENIHKYYNKKPIILLAPHFLALDLGALRLSLEIDGYSMYAEPHNKYLGEKLFEARTRFLGVGNLVKNNSIKKIIHQLRTTKKAMYYLPDHDMNEHYSVYAPFFAHQFCPTLSVLGRVISITGAVVMNMSTHRDGKNYVINISEELNITHQSSAEDMNKEIEKMIVPHMVHYLWLHKRFKTQPNRKRGDIYK